MSSVMNQPPPSLTPEQKHALLRQTFYSPREGFVSGRRLFEKLRPQVTYQEAMAFVENQALTQTMEPLRDIKYDTIWSAARRRIYCADLVDVSWWRGFNDKYNFIFVGLDIHSRRMFARPCRKKDTASVLAALKGMFEEMGTPKIIVTDLEKSIRSHVVQTISKRTMLNIGKLVQTASSVTACVNART